MVPRQFEHLIAESKVRACVSRRRSAPISLMAPRFAGLARHEPPHTPCGTNEYISVADRDLLKDRARVQASGTYMRRRVRLTNSFALLALLSLFAGCTDGARESPAEHKPK